MKREEIKVGMNVYHVTNEKVAMLVTYINPSGTDVNNCISCEWMSDQGIFYEKQFRPASLSEFFKL